MDLPKTTQVIGLSATLDNPQKMCSALTKINGKKTILCFTNKRIVPLEHNLLYFIPNAITKKLHGKPKEIVLEIARDLPLGADGKRDLQNFQKKN